MDFKTYWKSGNIPFVIKNLLLALLIGLVLLAGIYFWLKHYTRHGEELQVPNVCGMYIEEAQVTLQSVGLVLQVIDSTYSNKVPLGTIVEQNPSENSSVKKGRAVYVIANARTKRQVPVPDLRDVSCRQAETTLRALGLKVSQVVYEASEYKDLVLDIRRNGVSVNSGTRLPEGDSVVLVVGRGRGNTTVAVPDLAGKTLFDAREDLLGIHLIVGATVCDTPQEEEKVYYVYRQDPAAGVWAREGDHVDLYLSEDPDKRAGAVSTTEDEDFF